MLAPLAFLLAGQAFDSGMIALARMAAALGGHRAAVFTMVLDGARDDGSFRVALFAPDHYALVSRRYEYHSDGRIAYDVVVDSQTYARRLPAEGNDALGLIPGFDQLLAKAPGIAA